MSSRSPLAAISLLAAFAIGAGPKTPPARQIEIPGGTGGVGFDDLRFSPALGRLIVPAGRTGTIVLVDPATGSMKTIGGFSRSARFGGGHGESVTSADEGAGKLFATDRTSGLLEVVDPSSAQIIATVKLAASPDYVRYCAATNELWVTQPDSEQIELFSNPGKPAHSAFVRVAGGPESLVFDKTRGRAYTHLWNGRTASIDLKTRRIREVWSNGCRGSRGIALDESRGFLFAGCSEGKATVLDVAHGGKLLGSVEAGSGIDIIDYSPNLRHLYLPGGRSATLSIVAVSTEGKLSLLGAVAAATGGHCAATDGKGDIFVCDPPGGRLIWLTDPYPQTP